jgi:hypothetical protein
MKFILCDVITLQNELKVKIELSNLAHFSGISTKIIVGIEIVPTFAAPVFFIAFYSKRVVGKINLFVFTYCTQTLPSEKNRHKKH